MPYANHRIELTNLVLAFWHGDTGSLQHICDSANQVYSFIESGKRRYLRLTSSRDRTKKQVEAELDFITYLHRGGVNAMRPVASFAGQFIEEISFAGDILLATVFEEAEGEP